MWGPFVSKRDHICQVDELVSLSARKRELGIQCWGCGDALRNNKRVLEESDVYRELKAWRLEKFRSLRIPAYVILSDRSLRELSYHQPTNKDDLLNIHGVGDEKLSLYGDEILGILQGLEREDWSVMMDQYCGSCEGGLEQADAMEPLRDPAGDPKMANPVSQSVCPTCAQPWNGIRKRGKELGDIVESEERVNIFTTELSKNGTDRVVVTIQAITMFDLGATFDDYISDPRIGRVFNSNDTGPFLWLPEWVSRPMRYLGDNNQGYWLVTFQHSYRRT